MNFCAIFAILMELYPPWPIIEKVKDIKDDTKNSLGE